LTNPVVALHDRHDSCWLLGQAACQDAEMADPDEPDDAEPVRLVARPTLPGRPEDWFESPPSRFVRLSDVAVAGGRWPDLDSALGAAMQGEVAVWVPCADLQYLDGRFPVPAGQPFGRLDRADVAQTLRDGRAVIRGLFLSRGRVTLAKAIEVTAASLFIAATEEGAEASAHGPAPVPSPSRSRRRAGRRRGTRAGPESDQGTSEAEATSATGKVKPAAAAQTRRKEITAADEPVSPDPAEPQRSAATTPETSAHRPGGPGRMLRQKEVCKVTGLSRTSIWRIEKRGEFPERRKLGRQAVGWLESEVLAWIDAREVAGPGADVEERGER
jgi:predicted DNA-binding transcriptional regulator AlpA